MDKLRFDRWTRDVASGLSSRRGILAASLGIASLAGFGGQGIDGTYAKKKKCKRGKKRCGKKCVNLKSDRNNCGRCGQRCAGGRPDCVNGGCTASTCLQDAQFCAPGQPGCAADCGCGSSITGDPFCADCAHCIEPECESDADCLARGLPPGTVCGDGTGGFCDPCTRVCLTPCGSCTDCSCQPTPCADGFTLCDETCVAGTCCRPAAGPSPSCGTNCLCYVTTEGDNGCFDEFGTTCQECDDSDECPGSQRCIPGGCNQAGNACYSLCDD